MVVHYRFNRPEVFNLEVRTGARYDIQAICLNVVYSLMLILNVTKHAGNQECACCAKRGAYPNPVKGLQGLVTMCWACVKQCMQVVQHTYTKKRVC